MKVTPHPGRVTAIEALSPTLRRFTLTPEAGLFPAAAAGAHVMLTLRGEQRAWRNAYSLVSRPGAREAWQIIVRLVSPSRGGSAFLHERVAVGDPILIDPPVNLFPVAKLARKHLLIAGGIGATPFLSYLPTLTAPFELHQFCRPEDEPAFRRLLPGVHIHTARERIDLPALLAAQPLGTHLYTCGPPAFMDLVTSAARTCGYPAGKIHLERFGGATGGAAFRVVLQSSGQTIEVSPDQTLLDALEGAGIDAPCLCRGGACGQCRVGVLAGIPEHRDHVLTDAEHATNDAIMTCVSRARSPELVLDL